MRQTTYGTDHHPILEVWLDLVKLVYQIEIYIISCLEMLPSSFIANVQYKYKIIINWIIDRL